MKAPIFHIIFILYLLVVLIKHLLHVRAGKIGAERICSNINDSHTLSNFVPTETSAPDTTPPVISGCPSNIPVTISPGETSALVTWDEPTATDDSSGAVDVGRSHAPGSSFPVGSAVVLYSFTDTSGNLARCVFIVTVSGRLPSIIRGAYH